MSRNLRSTILKGLFLACTAIITGIVLPGTANAASQDDEKLVYCVLTVIAETRNQSGTVVGTEYYLKEFLLTDGAFFSDDFSTRTRFKFMDASMNTVDGDSTIDIDWFADISVFNSVDVSTAVTLGKGNKAGKSQGQHTFYTTGSSVRTTFFLECSEL